jgi:hypothetical protein
MAKAASGEVRVAKTKVVHEYTAADLRAAYEEMTSLIQCECEFTSDLVGGIPANPEAIRAFAAHHLKLEGAALEEAVTRIQAEELQDRTQAEDELSEKLQYGVKAIRKDEGGPFLGNWMVKACLKSAATRTGLFVTKRVKGDWVEMGEVKPFGPSVIPGLEREERRFCRNNIYIRNADNSGQAKVQYEEFRGSVSTPQGRKSIVVNTETVLAGSIFGFQVRFATGKTEEQDVRRMLSAACVIGLGSAKSYERGRFQMLTSRYEGLE